TVYTPAAQVVHLAGPRICSKLFDGPHHVMTVNIVTHLLALIAKTGIPAATKRYLNQIRQKTVLLHAGVRRPCQATASKNYHLHLEIAPVLLRDKIRRCFRRAEKRMQRLIDPASLRDTA